MTGVASALLPLAALAGTSGCVLCLHGIDGPADAPTASIHIPSEGFLTLIDTLRRVGDIVPLATLVEAAASGRGTRGMIALTADDAYASWLPLATTLRTRSIPLTLFAVGQALRDGSRFWWDRLDHLDRRLDGARWRALEDASGLPEAYRRGHAGSGDRSRAMRQWLLATAAGRLPAGVGSAIANEEAGLGSVTAQRSMTAAELVAFVAESGTTVGCHTDSHVVLPLLPEEEAEEEVRAGFRTLRQLLPNASPILAIPFGLFDARTVALGARAGMQASLTLQARPLRTGEGLRGGVPRICVVREQSSATLAVQTSRLGPLVRRVRGSDSEVVGYPAMPTATT